MPYGLLGAVGRHLRHAAVSKGLWATRKAPQCLLRIDIPQTSTRLVHFYNARPTQPLLDRTGLKPPLRRVTCAEGARRLTRQRTAYVDYIGDILRQHGRSDLVSSSSPHKPDLSVASPREHALARSVLNQASPTNHRPKLSLRRILATYLKYTLSQEKGEDSISLVEFAQQSWSGDLDIGFELTSLDKDYLSSHGYTILDVQSWAEFTTVRNAEVAMRRLTEHESVAGAASFPLSVLLYFTRRQHIPRGPLRHYIDHLRHALSQTAGLDHRQGTIMMAFARLARHARRVAPEHLGAVTELLLENLRDHTELGAKLLSERTFMLNRAMSLLSLTTSIRPYRSSELQQEAVAKILQYMTEHEPPLHISREGYRAVVRIQLRLPKTEAERQWASLKALSWPPWKQDRTAMDSVIGPEHGISKAGHSLKRMHEAGYAPHNLDKVASTYAGWSDDGTPSIQTRHALTTSSDNSAVWAARITTTRTIQEAWACWLAYEAQPVGYWHADVVFAILQKLQQNELQHASGSSARRPSPTHVLPGDMKELSHLPASIHLHTYTRTEPPSTHDFFKLLQDKGTRLQVPVAASLVSNARRLQHAYQYLQHLDQWYPGASALLSTNDEGIVKSLPSMLVASVAESLCRHPQVPLQTVVNEVVCSPTTGLTGKVFHDHLVSDQHSFPRAVWLLTHAQYTRASQWRHVFYALALNERRLRHLTTLSRLFTFTSSRYHSQHVEVQSAIALAIRAVVSYRLAQKVLAIMRTNMSLPLDLECFNILCIITARCGSSLESLLEMRMHESRELQILYRETGLVDELQLIRAERPAKWLADIFNDMAGVTSADDDAGMLAPGAIFAPAVFHSWLRALGSYGEHEAILQLVRIACAPGALTFQSQSDIESMRKSVTALRYYLERDDGETGPAAQSLIDEVKDLLQSGSEAWTDEFKLWASGEEVEEYGKGTVRQPL